MQNTQDILDRAVEQVIVRKDLEKLLESKKKLKVYLGIDPTSTRIHLGNAIPLRKLRDFQDAGHEVIFLVGSFTALIGDTSDKDAMRVPLSEKEIEKNFQTYKEQAAKILDFSKARIEYNGEWLSKLCFEDIVKLAQHFTVQQMIERDMYQKRLKESKPIGLHEFLYPLMQGYDSVELEVDIEIGGNDQLFNMLAGRTLLKAYKNKVKHVVATPLIEGLDGRKMSKSYGNTINITDKPNDMFGKIMSMHDDLIIKYFELCTDIPMHEIHEIAEGLKNGDNPRNAKAYLAREIVKLYHSEKESTSAEQAFENVFVKKGKPDDIKTVKIKSGSYQLDELLDELELAPSKTEAKRLVEQGGVKIDDKVVSDWKKKIDIKSDMIVQVGKRKFAKIKIK
ncbi:MAG: tyrosine--tRNA ligase [Parcubacteria group bacterium CG11_big_fil_rev_8_21_14_0_20_41_14]|nr:MAG: tyrosine--tRNA ligase [Parcubacteria group bacterium CG11_big_fil_rev_8_21_14_0_20_41_14]